MPATTLLTALVAASILYSTAQASPSATQANAFVSSFSASSTLAVPRLVIGPLTTTFTPAASCTAMINDDNPETAYFAQTCTGDGFNSDDPTCWPHTSGQVLGAAPLNGYGVYSPGLVCPVGYTSACSQTGKSFASQKTGAGNFAFQYPLSASETAVGCCPTGFICDVNDSENDPDYPYQTCIAVASSTRLTAIACDSSSEGPLVSMTTFDLPITTSFSVDSETYAPIQNMTIYAPLMQLVWQASDLESTGTVLGDGGNNTSSGATSTPSPPLPSLTSTSSSSLSGGAIGGIVVGAIAGLAAVIAAIWFFLRRRRQQQQAAAATEEGAEYKAVNQWDKAELPGADRDINELGGQTVYKPTEHIQELEAPGVTHELQE